MLICNLRKGQSVFRFAKEPTWHWHTRAGAPIDPEHIAARLAGRRVCLLAHGFNVPDALDVYARLALPLREARRYDAVVGVTWPASPVKAPAVGFFRARARAAEAA
jgi:hypothetical protein